MPFFLFSKSVMQIDFSLSWNNIRSGRNNENKNIRSKIAVQITPVLFYTITSLLDRIPTKQEQDNKDIGLNNASSDIHNKRAEKLGLLTSCSAWTPAKERGKKQWKENITIERTSCVMIFIPSLLRNQETDGGTLASVWGVLNHKCELHRNNWKR